MLNKKVTRLCIFVLFQNLESIQVFPILCDTSYGFILPLNDLYCIEFHFCYIKFVQSFLFSFIMKGSQNFIKCFISAIIEMII